MNKRKRHRGGQRRVKLRSCKYCYNTPKRHQGICGVCSERTKEENKVRYKILQGYETLTGFLDQSNISENNIKTIQSFLDASGSTSAVSGSEQAGSLACGLSEARSTFSDFATIVLEIGQNFPHKKRRIKRVKAARPELYDRMKRQEHLDWYFDEYEDCSFGDESE